jgi:hypothetical protein
MTLNQINTIIRNIIRTELGLLEHQVMPANTNQPTGDEPFVTVLIASIDGIGWDDVNIKDAPALTVTETGQGFRVMTVSVQFFRTGALTFAERLRAKLQLNSAYEKFALNGLGLLSKSAVRVLSAVPNTLWEERAQIDLSISIISKETNIIDTYGEFPLSISTESSNTVTSVFEP